VKKYDNSEYIGAEIVNAPDQTAENKPFLKNLNRVVGKLGGRTIDNKHQDAGHGKEGEQQQAGTAKRPRPVKSQCLKRDSPGMDVFNKSFDGLPGASDEPPIEYFED
jgi:hypothetical protein